MKGTPSLPKVLIIAEAANPEWVSVPLIGWSYSRSLLEVVDGHLVTHVRNREAILKKGLVEGKNFTPIDSEAVAKPIYKLGVWLAGGKEGGWTTRTALSSVSYYYFEWKVWQRFGRDIQQGRYDIVHRVTPLSPTVPSLLAPLCRRSNVPFILGPLNGGVPWPKGFDSVRRAEREWLSYIRSAYRLLPGYRATRQDASAILIASDSTLAQMPKKHHSKCFYLPENAIEPERFQRGSHIEQKSYDPPLRAVFVGRLVPYKGADMLLEAAAPLVRDGKLIVDIIGDGPQMQLLRDIVARERIEDGINLHGWVPHEELNECLQDAHILAFPSVREFGGGVVLEAMALGLVPVVVDYAGPGELVTPRTGFAIPIGKRTQIVSRFRRVLGDLASSPKKLPAMSSLCLRRAHEQFTWEAKAHQTLKIYNWVLDPSTERPHFPRPIPDPDVV